MFIMFLCFVFFVCLFFQLKGFCAKGRACNSDHVKKGIDSLPIIGDFSLGITSHRLPQSGKEWYATDSELVYPLTYI